MRVRKSRRLSIRVIPDKLRNNWKAKFEVEQSDVILTVDECSRLHQGNKELRIEKDKLKTVRLTCSE